MKRLLLAVLLLALALAAPVQAENVSLAFNDSGYIPFFSAPTGDPENGGGSEGMFIDFLDAFERAYPEHHVQQVHVPRKRANMMIQKGKIDGYALQSPLFADTEEGRFSFTTKIWTSVDAVFVRSDNPKCYANAEELQGKELGIISGYGYGPLDAGLANGSIQGVEVKTHPQLYKMLLRNRVDAIVGNLLVLPYNVKKLGLDITNFKLCRPSLYQFDLSVFVRSDKRAFIRDFNAFIEESRANGLIDAIEERWLGTHDF